MKILIALLLLLPCLVIARDTHKKDFIENDIDMDAYHILKDKPKDEQMYQYAHNKATELSYKKCQIKKFSHEWYYLMGQVDAFTQVHRIYTLEKN